MSKAVGRKVARGGLGLALAALLISTCTPGWADDDTARFALGKRLFTRGALPSCAVCHTLQAADAQGTIGPVLDELKPDATRVMRALRTGIGQMPSYQNTLSEAEKEALAVFVSRASAGN